jgi:hypothetical protein
MIPSSTGCEQSIVYFFTTFFFRIFLACSQGRRPDEHTSSQSMRMTRRGLEGWAGAHRCHGAGDVRSPKEEKKRVLSCSSGSFFTRAGGVRGVGCGVRGVSLSLERTAQCAVSTLHLLNCATDAAHNTADTTPPTDSPWEGSAAAHPRPKVPPHGTLYADRSRTCVDYALRRAVRRKHAAFVGPSWSVRG